MAMANFNKDEMHAGTIRIVCVSIPLSLGDKDANLAQMEAVVASEAVGGAELFVFPEVCLVGGFPVGTGQDEFYRRVAEMVPDGPSCHKVAEIAERHNTTICAGMIEWDGFSYFITHFLCSPRRVLGCQRKLFPQNPEKSGFFSSGNCLRRFELFGHKLAILACADFMFPESTLLAGINDDLSIIVCPSDGMDVENIDIMLKLLLAKSMGTGANVVAVFGETLQEKRTKVLAYAAVDLNGEIIANETKKIGECRIGCVPIKLRASRKIWGGSRWRAKTILEILKAELKDEGGTPLI